MKYAEFRTAFTLIELLVTISVIAILSALAIPVLSQAKAKARNAECANNLRQIGIAARVYAGDHDGFLPRIENGQGNRISPQTSPLFEALGSYLGGETKVLRCPADKEELHKERGTSYVWNAAFNNRLIDNDHPERRLDGPMVSDAEEWHQGQKNGVFEDGAVKRLESSRW